jgi:hypothetical protein
VRARQWGVRPGMKRTVREVMERLEETSIQGGLGASAAIWRARSLMY